MTPRAVHAEHAARRWLAVGAASALLWQAARIVPGNAPDWLLVTAGVVQLPLAVATVAGFWHAAQRRGWAAGHEAAQPRPIPREETNR
ncbi:hypothetical protein GCM10010399_44330 [Dactylosporangium fulvum]